MSDTRRTIFNVAAWLVAEAEAAERAGDLEAALRFLQRAASLLIRQNQRLVDPGIEAALLRIAAAVHGGTTSTPRQRADGEGAARVLHVINEALPYGGHTAMAVRWIVADDKRHNDVALTDQKCPVPETIERAVAIGRGAVHRFDESGTLVARARRLRELSAGYDAVVLHVGTDDVIAAVAYGVPGGPPVLLVNHAAHIYWVGIATTDVVINCRGSLLEEHWTLEHRGARRCAIVPIPLPEPLIQPEVAERQRALVRKNLGISASAALILTVGDSFKYQASRTHDFVAVAADILRDLQDAHLVAVGVKRDARWDAQPPHIRSRMHALGRQSDVAQFHAAADIYIDGFPFGSTTAFLEAALAGLPCVLSPSDAPPPYGTDGIAIDLVLERPADPRHYTAYVTALARSAELRQCNVGQILESIRAHHVAPHWNRHLDSLMAELPAIHEVKPAGPTSTVSTEMADYWTEFRERSGLDGSSSAVIAAEQIQFLAGNAIQARLPWRLLDFGHSLQHRRFDRWLAALAIWVVFCVLRPVLAGHITKQLWRRIRWMEFPGSRLHRMNQWLFSPTTESNPRAARRSARRITNA